MSSDKRQIGLRSAENTISEQIENSGLFPNAIAVGRFAFAVAVRRRVGVGRAEGASTKWHVGDLDPDRELATVVSAIYPDCADEPYRQVEFLINEGLALIGSTTKTRTLEDGTEIRRIPDIILMVEQINDSEPGEGS